MINIREFLGLGYYTSDLDKFIIEFNQTHQEISASERKEIEKYMHIFALRDNPEQPRIKETIWDKF